MNLYDVWINGVRYHGEEVSLDTALRDCQDFQESRIQIFDADGEVSCEELQERSKYAYDDHSL